MSRFRPRLVPSILTFVALAMLVSLGTWQYLRYRGKLETEQIRDERVEMPSRTLENASDLTEDDDFRVVRLRGRFADEYTFLVKHRTHRGRPGSWVVQPLVYADGSAVLVNRGFVPFEAARDEAERVSRSDADELRGLVHTPEQLVPDDDARTRFAAERAREGELVELDSLDIAAMYDALPFETPDRDTIVILGSEHSGDPYPIASYDYVTEPYLTSERHLGYSLFWYILAAALLAIWIGHAFGKVGGDPRIRES